MTGLLQFFISPLCLERFYGTASHQSNWHWECCNRTEVSVENKYKHPCQSRVELLRICWALLLASFNYRKLQGPSEPSSVILFQSYVMLLQVLSTYRITNHTLDRKQSLNAGHQTRLDLSRLFSFWMFVTISAFFLMKYKFVMMDS